MRPRLQSQFSLVYRNSIAISAGLALLSAFAPAQTPVTPAFTYQAQIAASGQPLTGTADLQFTLFDAAAGGVQIGTTQTVLNANVVDGLFNAQLNFGAAAYNGDARWVEIAVRSPAGSGAYTTLTPRQPLTAAPYAQYAMTAQNGGVLTIDNGQPGVMWTRSPNNIDVFLSSSTSAAFGFSSPVARLHVRAPAGLPAETSRFEDVFGRSQLRLATPESAGRAELQAWNGQTNVAGPLILNVGGGNVGIGTNAPSSLLDVAGSFETNAFRLNGNGAAAGRILTSDASGNGAWQAPPTATQWTTNGANIGYTAGNVGIGITTPANRLDVEGALAVGSTYSGVSAAPANGLIVEGRMGLGTASPNGNFQLQIAGGGGVWRGALAATGTANSVVAGELSGIATIGGHNAALSAWANLAINPAGGNVGIGTNAPTSKLDVVGTVTSDGLTVAGDGSITGNLGIGTTTPAAKLDVIGMARVQALTITGGSDVAEPFNINCDEATERRSDEAAANADLQSKIQFPKSKIEPGMVVTIDPDRIGELRISGKVYDKAVAGVISGANGVNPGMVLTQTGSVADGKHPVALTGRVWAWCDADAGGAIVAGDMLTTSDTPGHAMRVGDSNSANGAVIGKAMSSLKSGKGMVLVLVNLQ